MNLEYHITLVVSTLIKVNTSYRSSFFMNKTFSKNQNLNVKLVEMGIRRWLMGSLNSYEQKPNYSSFWHTN